MSQFISNLDVELVDGVRWRLRNPLVFHSDRLGVVSVPEGFVTDFVTIPRVPLFFALFGDTAHCAAALHDWLYTAPVLCSRADADHVFFDAALCSGVVGWKARAMYLGIRLFGHRYYNKEARP